MQIKNKNHLVEYISRNPEKLEEGLTFLDCNIETVGADMIDVLALDKDDRIVIIIARDVPQFAKGKNVHILKESLVLWDWIVDQKDDYFTAVQYLTGKQPARIPPRLFAIAPSYEGSVLKIARSIETRIDLDVFEYDPNKGGIFNKVHLKEYKIPTREQRQRLVAYVDDQLSVLRELYAHKIKDTMFVGYEPITTGDFISKISDKKGSEKLSEILKTAGKHNIAARPKKNNLSLVNEFGETVAVIPAKNSEDIMIEIKPGSPKNEIKPITDSEEILAEITS